MPPFFNPRVRADRGPLPRPQPLVKNPPAPDLKKGVLGHSFAGEIRLSPEGELLLNGKTGFAARDEAALLVQSGVSPFRHATLEQRQRLLTDLTEIVKEGVQRPSDAGLLNRSSAATLLLSLARTSPASIQGPALESYVTAMGKEKNFELAASMLNNLNFDRLQLTKPQEVVRQRLEQRETPSVMAYEEWWGKSKKPKLEVRHYVMEDFWKTEIKAHKARGFELVSETSKSAVFKGVLSDPKGKHPDVAVHIKMEKSHENILRDMDDPSVHMVLYSGHSQLGAVLDQSLAVAPKVMKGTKALFVFNCRADQSEPGIREQFPGIHLTTTMKSSYSEDDAKVLDQVFLMIGRRGKYEEVMPAIKFKKRDGEKPKRNDRVPGRYADKMVQPKKNYKLPNDRRHLESRNDDEDLLKNMSAIGPDRYYNPARRFARGGNHSFKMVEEITDPRKISGQKLDHALGYYNSSLYYFAQENRAAPITFDETDSFISGGWFASAKDELARITEFKDEGKTLYRTAINSRLAPRAREVTTAVTIMEGQLYLALKEIPKNADAKTRQAALEKAKLQGLMLVGEYLDLYTDSQTQFDAVLAGFNEQYGVKGFNYNVYYEATQSVGSDNGTKAIKFLKEAGVSFS